LLDREDVQQRIAEEFVLRTQAAKVDVEAVLRELNQIANCDINEVYAEDGTILPIHAIPVHVRKAISAIEVDELWEYEGSRKERKKVQVGVTKKLKFWDKTKCVELLGKYLAMFVERSRLENADGSPLPAVQVHIHKHVIPVAASVEATLSAPRPEVVNA
jgi:hypothetical protein